MNKQAVLTRQTAEVYIVHSDKTHEWAGYDTGINIEGFRVQLETLNLRLQALQQYIAWGKIWE